MNRESFDLLAETYDWIHTFKGDIQFWIHHAKQGGGRVLELGCGTGRITWEVAGAGFPVVALDISPGMLKLADAKRALYPDAASVIFKCEDMRKFKLGIKFPVIIMPGRSFEHILTTDDQIETLKNCVDHLNDQGKIIIFVFGPPPDDADEKSEEFHGNIINPDSGNLCRYSTRQSIDRERQIITVRQRLEELSANGDIYREWIYAPIQYRWSTAEELEKLGHALNLKIVGRYSDWLKKPYKKGDRYLIYIYQKCSIN